MPIEFCCPQCQRVLRVSEEHAGKAARCPDCATVMYVPGGDPVPEEPSMSYGFGGIESPVSRQPNQAGMPPAKTPAGPDPWARPQVRTEQRPRKPPGAGQVRPVAVSIDTIMSYAWRACQANFGLLVGVNLLVLGVGLFFGITQGIVDNALQPGNAAVAPRSLQGSMIGIFGNLLSIFLGIGQVRVNYEIARTGRGNFATLFSGGDRFLPAIGATLVAVVALVLGLICLIIPGLLMIVVFWTYFHLIADHKEDVMGSFNTALEIGKRNIGTSILLCLTSFVLLFGGALALLIGLIFVIPYVSMLWSVAYLKMAGQI